MPERDGARGEPELPGARDCQTGMALLRTQYQNRMAPWAIRSCPAPYQRRGMMPVVCQSGMEPRATLTATAPYQKRMVSPRMPERDGAHRMP